MKEINKEEWSDRIQYYLSEWHNTTKKNETDIKVLAGSVSNDANHISGPSRTGDGQFFAIESALKEAQLKNEEVDHISAHGTATPYNDEMESKALTLARIPSRLHRS